MAEYYIKHEMQKRNIVIGFKRQFTNRCADYLVPRTFLLSLCWLTFVVGALSTVPSFAQSEAQASKSTATFLVVRHAERDGDLDRLTKAGEERSQLLASLGTALKVSRIYSTDTQRTKGTAQPLATATGAEIAIYRKLSEKWIATLEQKHAGQVVLIVGHSNTTGVIAGLLANSEAFAIEHDEYDALFIIQATESGGHCLRLQYGNASKSASSAAPDKMGELETSRVSK